VRHLPTTPRLDLCPYAATMANVAMVLQTMDKFSILAEELVVDPFPREFVMALLKLERAIEIGQGVHQVLPSPNRHQPSASGTTEYPTRELARDGMLIWLRLVSESKKQGFLASPEEPTEGADTSMVKALFADQFYRCAAVQFSCQVFAEYLLSMPVPTSDSGLGLEYAKAALSGVYERRLFVPILEAFSTLQLLEQENNSSSGAIVVPITNQLLTATIGAVLPKILLLVRLAHLKLDVEKRQHSPGNLFSQASMAAWHTIGEGDVREQRDEASMIVDALAASLR
jgi:hypothetical protein